MGERTLLCAIGVVLLPSFAVAQSADVAARDAAAGCAACHGTDGVSRGPLPSLAGQPRAQLLATLREFKAGTRAGTVMPQLARGYTDAQIEGIAAWFAARAAR